MAVTQDDHLQCLITFVVLFELPYFYEKGARLCIEYAFCKGLQFLLYLMLLTKKPNCSYYLNCEIRHHEIALKCSKHCGAKQN